MVWIQERGVRVHTSKGSVTEAHVAEVEMTFL